MEQVQKEVVTKDKESVVSKCLEVTELLQQQTNIIAATKRALFSSPRVESAIFTTAATATHAISAGSVVFACTRNKKNVVCAFFYSSSSSSSGSSRAATCWSS
jgi:hypothetical protein